MFYEIIGFIFALALLGSITYIYISSIWYSVNITGFDKWAFVWVPAVLGFIVWAWYLIISSIKVCFI